MGFGPIATELSLIDTVALTLAEGQFLGGLDPSFAPLLRPTFNARHYQQRNGIAACLTANFIRSLPRPYSAGTQPLEAFWTTATYQIFARRRPREVLVPHPSRTVRTLLRW